MGKGGEDVKSEPVGKKKKILEKVLIKPTLASSWGPDKLLHGPAVRIV